MFSAASGFWLWTFSAVPSLKPLRRAAAGAPESVLRADADGARPKDGRRTDLVDDADAAGWLRHTEEEIGG